MTAPAPSTPTPTSSKLTGRLWVVAAAVMWSICGLIVKAGFFDDWPLSVQGPLLAFWRAFFAALILLPLARRPKFTVGMVPMTVCFTVMSITYLTAITLTTAANAIWLQATSPWWIFLISVLVLREPIVRRDLIPLWFGAVGVGLILFFEIRLGGRAVGVACGLLSGVTFGGMILFLRRLRNHNAVWLIGLNHAVAALVMVPWIVWLGVWPSAFQLVVLAGFGAIQMGIPYVCMIRGLRSITSQEAAAIVLLEPVLNPLWVLMLGLETPRWWTVVGASLILAGLLSRYVVLEWFWPARDGH